MDALLKYCILGSNLHSGGGVQVAASFLAGLMEMPALAAQCSVIVSSEVDKNLRQLNLRYESFLTYEVLDHYGLSMLWSGLGRRLRDFDVVFTVFGPLYLIRKPKVSVVGFAQPWIIYPDNEIYHSLVWWEKLLVRIKFFLQALFFKRADMIIVELNHVKKSLVNQKIALHQKIRIVSNCLSDVFLNPKLWQPVNNLNKSSSNSLSLGFIGRAYPHKNIKILPAVLECLRSRYQIDVEIYVTLNHSEWAACSEEFRKKILNVGELTIAQCPEFYRAMDGIIFPSLLECFSATPLEVMVMERPLFASNRPFIRDVCGDFAYYFNPLDADDIASKIATYFLDNDQINVNLSLAKSHAIHYPNNKKRVVDYMSCLNEAAIVHKLKE
jgi:hypothetical protein